MTATETRTTWRLKERPPEGYRFGHNNWDETTEIMWSLYIGPGDLFERDLLWIENEKHAETREVTEWRTAA